MSKMPVCRYFLQGNCRFGDRCRFKHTESFDTYDTKSNVGRQYGQTNTQQYNQRYEYSGNYRNQRSNSPEGCYENYQYQASSPHSPGTYRNDYNYYNNQKQSYYNPDGTFRTSYSENYRPVSPSEHSYSNYQNYKHDYNNYNNQKHNYSSARYSDNYRNQSDKDRRSNLEYPQHNEKTHGRNQQYQYSNSQHDDTYGQNKFKWQSNDYKKQSQPKTHSSSDFTSETYNTSTPKGKVSFSFKVLESEIRKKSSSDYVVNEDDQIRAELVKEDSKAWELGGLWPFTSYGPFTDKPGFPGFYDVSPEELRYAAYKAEENNAYESYVQSVQNALVQIEQQRSQLQIPTPQLFATLRRVFGGENLCSAPGVIATIPFLQCEESNVDVMDTPIEDPISSAAAAFSFKIGTETDSSAKASTAATFSFKLQAASETKFPTMVSSGDPEVYSAVENLTEEEKEQFSASTFILGKIPTKPPPQVLCR